MSRIWGSAAIAGSILFGWQTATGPPALALEGQLELTNNTRMAIIEIDIARVGTGRWKRDLLGSQILQPAQSALVDIDEVTAIAGSTSGQSSMMGPAGSVGTSTFAQWSGSPFLIDSTRACLQAVAY